MIKKLSGLAIVLGLWFLLHLGLQSPAVPNPFVTIEYTFANVANFAPHILYSMMRILLATFFAATIGIGIGVVMGLNSKFDKVASPLVYILNPIPKVALLPVFMILFGLNEKPKIILIFSVIVFQYIMSTKDAIVDIEKSYFDSVYALGLRKWGLIRHCVLPAILPSIFTSLRVSFGVSLAILFFAENFSTKFGMGYSIMNSYAMANYHSMYAGILILSLLGLVIYSIIDIIEHYVCPWLVKNS